ncbi:hypothetical protein QR680_012388 [Steinernema hermaphroditum]|uniref:DDHD domain-containing protein n=1 Tax=Steinernema hermaphroditum TaxID=289476 RepID=A0AA39I373_9BILA|nr:hypothetical protein QR680_012388 [Steinernema hermaphroditum]
MLIKEYRILLPLTVEEYRIAQLYMIQKKSRIDSSGAGSGVEIITNRPYSGEGPGGSGQYTFKIYHIGSKIPGWIRSILPTAALEAHEEAWNAYPLTKTRYSCPLMDKFSIEVETKYYDDAGIQENVFGLTPEELKNRVVDVMDFVKDSVSSHDYCKEEDPKLYVSKKTNRGPLDDNWVETALAQKRPVMCAYKLCRVEFRYWGMQSRAERWIHDWALKGTMMRAHRQAWAWQDEWVDLTIEDIRKLEEEVAIHLSKVMAATNSDDAGDSDSESDIFFDCTDVSPVHSTKPSLIRWSSELLVNDGDSPPLTPRPGDNNSLLLIIVFQADVLSEKSSGSSQTKVTDTTTLKATIEQLVRSHYPQLKKRVHVLTVPCCVDSIANQIAALGQISPSFGAFHPSLALMLTADKQLLQRATRETIKRVNQKLADFEATELGRSFSGEIFVVGDSLGGLLMYEALAAQTRSHAPISRHSSSVSQQSSAHTTGPILENESLCDLDTETPGTWSLHEFNSSSSSSHHSSHLARPAPLKPYSRNLSAPPSATSTRMRFTLQAHEDLNNHDIPSLHFRPSHAFLLGCPLALVLMQRKMNGDGVDTLDCDQLFNLYYSLDPCAARIEPVLNAQLGYLPAAEIPRYQRFPLGDGRSIRFHPPLSAEDAALLWGSRRIDHMLYCPQSMVSLPSGALPNILHASYWESCDVASFILRQFVRADDGGAVQTAFGGATQITSPLPLNIDMGPAVWSRRRNKFKIANLAANHRANDVVCMEGHEQIVAARFAYGPMDIVVLSRENVTVYVCPYGGEWQFHTTAVTDAHGRLTVSLGQRLAVGIHSVKMVVKGDHSYLDLFVAVVPQRTKCVVFSVDGSLTGSVSVTGKDPRVRPGAVDVVRHWQQLGYLIIYVTARPDMQQRAVGAWLAQHNFPHAMLMFTPSFSTEPLRQKTQHLRHLIDMGLSVTAAYGSNKDIAVYSGAGLSADHIFCISHSSKRRGCVPIESYALHLDDLNQGKVALAQPVIESIMANGSSRGPVTSAPPSFRLPLY